MFEAIISGYRWFFLQLAAVVGYGWGIVALSLITSAAMMPLMKAVAGVVRRETEYQGVILPQIAAINKMYGSDIERNLHIQRLYARYAYSPLSAVKKVLPLFVQIPFLLLTYFMLKGTAQLAGVPFLFLRDLGLPDALAHGLNLLPFVMTGVNLITVAATPGFTSRDKIQAVSIALLFLVMLYAAPSALLLYWTLNNAITMVRTIFAKRGEGAKLLVTRITAMRATPARLWAFLTADRLEWISFALLLASMYMWLMVYMEVWFFNCYISRFLMLPTLFAAVFLKALAHCRREAKFKRTMAAIAVVCAAMSVVLLGATALVVVAPKVMKTITENLDFVKTYKALLAIWIGGNLLLRVNKKVNWCGLASCLFEEWHWLLLSIVLALHYSVASDFVKLTLGSTFVLAAYMTLTSLAIAVVVAFAMGDSPKQRLYFRTSMVFCIAAYVVPMVSLESGKMLGYSSNLVLRLALMLVAAAIAVRLNKRKPVLVFIVLALILSTVNVVRENLQKGVEASKVENRVYSDAEHAFLEAKAKRHNSIYLLIYDGYAHDEVLRNTGIRELSKINDILLSRGFTCYNSYSVGSDTVASMGNSFAIGDVKQGSVRSMMAGNNPLCDFLRRAGYRTSYALCAYDMPNQGEIMPGDFYFPSPQAVTRLENVIFSGILRGFLSQSPNAFNSYTEEEWNDVKHELIANASQECSFVYAHDAYPGHAVASQVYRKSDEEEIKAYAERMRIADSHLEEDVDMVLSKADDSIIIVASDHGGLLKICERGDYGRMDILDRCGIQLYVRWPEGYEPALDMDCFSDVFLELMICLTGDTGLARFETDGATLPIQAPLKAPSGAVRKGVIQLGRDAGKRLIEIQNGNVPCP